LVAEAKVCSVSFPVQRLNYESKVKKCLDEYAITLIEKADLDKPHQKFLQALILSAGEGEGGFKEAKHYTLYDKTGKTKNKNKK
jgi:hypothetical protein